MPGHLLLSLVLVERDELLDDVAQLRLGLLVRLRLDVGLELAELRDPAEREPMVLFPPPQRVRVIQLPSVYVHAGPVLFLDPPLRHLHRQESALRAEALLAAAIRGRALVFHVQSRVAVALHGVDQLAQVLVEQLRG